MENQIIEPIYIIGIAVRTSNQNGQSAQDIPALWGRFYSENISAQLENKVNNDVYGIYTEYEGDYTQPYTTIVGHAVENLDLVPEGLKAIKIEGGPYLKKIAKGNLNEGVVFHAWQEIWQSDLNRAYQTDFEVYGKEAQNPEAAEVPIYIGVKEN